MATHQLKGGHKPNESVLKTWNLALRLLWMVTYHPQDGHSLSLGRSPTIKNMVTNLPEDGHPFSKYGHQPSPGWSTTIPSRVTQHPKFGHEESCPSSSRWSPTVPRVGSHTIPVIRPGNSAKCFWELKCFYRKISAKRGNILG